MFMGCLCDREHTRCDIARVTAWRGIPTVTNFCHCAHTCGVAGLVGHLDSNAKRWGSRVIELEYGSRDDGGSTNLL